MTALQSTNFFLIFASKFTIIIIKESANNLMVYIKNLFLSNEIFKIIKEVVKNRNVY